MKKRIIILILIVIAVIVVVISTKINKNKSTRQIPDFAKDENISFNKEDRQTEKKETTLSQNLEITSGLTDALDLHTTYYLEEIYVEENQYVEQGENILKYTNGSYLVAPYDGYIIEINLPSIEEQILNTHSIKFSSSKVLQVTMNVDETYINDISVGKEATIEITSLEKTYLGYITHIASTGNNGKFEIKIEFENDGDILLGMTSEVSITV